jgi:predicted amidohydrolase YtcJ
MADFSMDSFYAHLYTLDLNMAINRQADFEADPIVRGRPVVLLSKDGHAFWCSKKAMASALSFPETVQGGVIVRDSHDRPTGKSSQWIDLGILTTP